MKLRIDKAGRIRLPKELRRRLGMRCGSKLEAIEVDGGILLRNRNQQETMVQIGGIWVHQGASKPGLDWDHVIDDMREERIRDTLGSWQSVPPLRGSLQE
jgi:AbrB family looped-hinge helix DNA binding protein